MDARQGRGARARRPRQGKASRERKRKGKKRKSIRSRLLFLSLPLPSPTPNPHPPYRNASSCPSASSASSSSPGSDACSLSASLAETRSSRSSSALAPTAERARCSRAETCSPASLISGCFLCGRKRVKRVFIWMVGSRFARESARESARSFERWRKKYSRIVLQVERFNPLVKSQQPSPSPAATDFFPTLFSKNSNFIFPLSLLTLLQRGQALAVGPEPGLLRVEHEELGRGVGLVGCWVVLTFFVCF